MICQFIPGPAIRAGRSAFVAYVTMGLIFAVQARGQLLNIDFGDPATSDGDYVGVAASGQGGIWNYINEGMEAGVEIGLFNADGTDTGVTISVDLDTLTFDPGETGGGTLVDLALMGDIHWENPGANRIYEIRNLAPGEYSLFLYSYAADVINDDSIFTVNGESQTVAHVGPPDPSCQQVADTFAFYFPVSPDENGTIAFEVDAGPGVPPADNFWQLNGLQLAGDPSELVPRIDFEQPHRGTDEFGCCAYEWTLTNSSPFETISEWCMEIEAGSGGRIAECIGIDSLTVEGNWLVNFCYPWDEGQGPSSPSSRAVICFTEGDPLAPCETLSGTIIFDIHGDADFKIEPPDPLELPYDPPGNHLVLPNSVHVHLRTGPPDQDCASGAFNSHNGSSQGWGEGIDLECLPAFLPVPALSTYGKGLLVLVTAGCGLLVLRRLGRASL